MVVISKVVIFFDGEKKLKAELNGIQFKFLIEKVNDLNTTINYLESIQAIKEEKVDELLQKKDSKKN